VADRIKLAKGDHCGAPEFAAKTSALGFNTLLCAALRGKLQARRATGLTGVTGRSLGAQEPKYRHAY